MRRYKVDLKDFPRLEIWKEQIWRKDFVPIAEVEADLKEWEARLKRVFAKDRVYRYCNMVGVQGVTLFN